MKSRFYGVGRLAGAVLLAACANMLVAKQLTEEQLRQLLRAQQVEKSIREYYMESSKALSEAPRLDRLKYKWKAAMHGIKHKIEQDRIRVPSLPAFKLFREAEAHINAAYRKRKKELTAAGGPDSFRPLPEIVPPWEKK